MEVCFAAIKQDGYALEHVPESLKMPKICLEAIQQNAMALKYVPENLKTKELCLEAIRMAGRNHLPELRLSELELDILDGKASGDSKN